MGANFPSSSLIDVPEAAAPQNNTYEQGNSAFGAVPIELDPTTLADAGSSSPVRPIAAGAYSPNPDPHRSSRSRAMMPSMGLGLGIGMGAGSESPEKRSEQEGEETMEIEDDD